MSISRMPVHMPSHQLEMVEIVLLVFLMTFIIAPLFGVSLYQWWVAILVVFMLLPTVLFAVFL